MVIRCPRPLLQLDPISRLGPITAVNAARESVLDAVNKMTDG